jgi:hypothetical protein
MGAGLRTARFDLLALLIIGAAGCLAGSKMFRWDAQQRFATRAGKAWVTVAIAAWAAVGLLAESRGRIVTAAPESQAVVRSAPARTAVPGINPALSSAEMAAANAPASSARTPAPSSGPGGEPAAEPPSRPEPSPREREAAPASAARGASPNGTPVAPPAPKPDVPASPKVDGPAAAPAEPSSWQAVTLEQIDRDLVFDRLPSDSGIVTPIAPADEDPDPDVARDVDFIRENLPQWQPGKVADPVQRARNYLYVAGVPDVFQLPIERYIASVVFERMQEDIPKQQLIQVLYWIALHPGDGDDIAVDQLWALHLPNERPDMMQVRDRVALYAVKLLGRVTGRIKVG